MTQPSRILVLAAGSLGDAVLTLSAIERLQTKGHVTIAGTAPYIQLGARLLDVERVLPLEALLQTLHTDTPLDPAFWGSFTEVYFFFKTPDAVAFQKLAALGHLKLRQPAETFENFLKKERWAGEYWTALVLPHGSNENLAPAHLKIDDSVRERGALLCDFLQVTNPLIIHPGSGNPAKNAPLSFFKKAAEKTAAETGKDVLVIWGDAELGIADDIMETFRGIEKVKVLPDLLMLQDLVAVLTQARGYLGNDSGVTHLASACGVKTFAVFNTTDARVWGPQEAIILAAMQNLISSR